MSVSYDANVIKLGYIVVKNGKVGTYIKGTFVTTKSATLQSGASASIVKSASNLVNKGSFEPGDYLPFSPAVGELKAFEDSGTIYYIFNDNGNKYSTTEANKTFILQGPVEIQEGSEVFADIKKGKQFKAFKLED